MIDEVLSLASNKMEKTIEAVKKELATIRTGRATPALIENIKVDYYGTPTPLKQIATITAPEARLLVIQPWDNGTLSSISKAILKSDLGLNPTSDKNIIRLTIPHLSEDRRKELVKAVHKRKCKKRRHGRSQNIGARQGDLPGRTKTRPGSAPGAYR